MLVGRFLVGLITVAVGVLALKFNYKLVNTVGRNSFAERKLGAGSSFLFYQIIAVIVIIFGLLYMFGLHDNVLSFIFAPLLQIFERGGGL